MLNNIQILRAWASIIVVFYHTLGMAKSYEQESQYLSFFGSWGVHGVDIFFVISGFIMYYTQIQKNNKPYKFLKDRAIRIVPIYWILTSIYLSLYWILPTLFREYQSSIEYILSSYFLISGVLYNNHPILSYGWTLEYEMIFYLIFFLVLFLPKKYLFIASSALLFLVYLISSNLSIVLLEFILGMAVAKIYLKNKKITLAFIYLFLGVALLMSSVLINVSESNRLFWFGIPSFLIVVGLLGIKEVKNKILIFLGAASYSIYLIHVFTLPLFYKIVPKYLEFISNDILIFLALIFTIFVGGGFYILVEKPVTSFLKRY